MNRKIRYSLLLVLTLSSLLPIAACTGASVQDIQGMLQAVDGKEVVVTLADGTTVRFTANDDNLAAKANDLLGKTIEVKVSGNDAIEVQRLGEDAHFTGAIESMGAGTWVIGGRTFQVNGSTMLDGGLKPGAVARVEAVQLPNGAFLATEIETDEQEGHFAGKIESMDNGAVTIGGKTFSINDVTRLDSGLAPGVTARIEFVTMANGALVALEVETDQPKDHVVGAVTSLRPDAVVIDGQPIKINAATRFLDEPSASARVQVIKLADGSLLATKVEFERARIEIEREDLQRREQELRGREQELERREAEVRGREAEGEGPRGEGELRGREAEGEGPRGEGELRGREAEGEGARGQEAEARGREAEGEGARGQEAEPGRGGGDDSGGDDSGGSDDNGGSSGSSGSSGSGS